MADVTVIIPSRDRESTLHAVLGTYLQQPHVAEVIVVDDGSAHPYAEPALDRVRLLRHRRSLGSCAARNAGIREARTPWILVGEDDLELETGHVEALLEGAAQHRARVVAGRVVQQHGTETLDEADARWRDSGLRLFDRKAVTVQSVMALHDVEVPFCHAIHLVRTELARTTWYAPSIGGPSFMREDQEFTLRLRRDGHPMWLIAGARSLHWSHERTAGGGTRTYRSAAAQTASALINTWQVIDAYHDLIRPFFGMSRDEMLRAALGRAAYLELKRVAQSRSRIVRGATRIVRHARD